MATRRARPPRGSSGKPDVYNTLGGMSECIRESTDRIYKGERENVSSGGDATRHWPVDQRLTLAQSSP